MRACPFCGAENHDDGSHCVRCARRLSTTGQRAAVAPPVLTNRVAVVPPPIKRDAGSPPPMPANAPARPGSVPGGRASGSMPALPGGPAASSAPPIPRFVTGDAQRSGPVGRAWTAEPTPPPAVLTPSTLSPTPPPPAGEAREALPSEGPKAPGSAVEIIERPREATPSDATGYVPHPGAADLPSAGVMPLPEAPDSGLFSFARYAIVFARARVERAKAIKALGVEVEEHVGRLDAVLGQLGKLVRALKIETKALAEENLALDRAEATRQLSDRTVGELTVHRAEENRKYEEIQRELTAKIAEREETLTKAHGELERLEEKRKVLRERRRDLERRQKGILKSAEAREDQAAKEQIVEQRDKLRASAAELNADAKVLGPELDELERALAASDKPLREAEIADRDARAELEAARDALSRAKDGHKHRLVEMDSEQGRRLRDVSVADGEIARRLVTLGTIVNLHRVERPDFRPLYDRVDELRRAIGLREGEIDRLAGERAPTHRGALIRGIAVLGVGAILLLTAVCIAIALT